jgi:hypothetical protein
MVNSLKDWHDTRLGLLTLGLIELGLMYGFLCLSIDRGNPWWYLATLIFLIGGLKNLFKLVGTMIHGKHEAS